MLLHVDELERSPDARGRGRTTGSALPANVTTLRLWVSSRELSSTVTPSIWPMAVTISSTTSCRRPSLKFGTHSINPGTSVIVVGVTREPPSKRAALIRSDRWQPPARSISWPSPSATPRICRPALERRCGRWRSWRPRTHRHFATLARHHAIDVRAVSYHDHNEDARTRELVARLEAGEDVALVSDAGTPLVSDPGFRLVRRRSTPASRSRAFPDPRRSRLRWPRRSAAASVPLRWLPAAYHGGTASGAGRRLHG